MLVHHWVHPSPTQWCRIYRVLSCFEVIEDLWASISIRLHSINWLIRSLGSPTSQETLLISRSLFLKQFHCSPFHIAVAWFSRNLELAIQQHFTITNTTQDPGNASSVGEALGNLRLTSLRHHPLFLPRFQLTCHPVKLKSREQGYNDTSINYPYSIL